ncbi:hypothetical protein M422DRAFT_69935 [Sphaerobolus stellatus SS14]|uniref:3-beta hydroxysteroid dehydrogenase/isomerase domain-containing protein n=1 Tax=Sphaerobolus stellatus (strain SS14) TaxID=990650 RepID=A0A0C9VAM2_SPHS4|nr:hypothetical protein M422DRAFT_233426 [Sphaerobolus stellatus SS14]KIJ35507.1 hypothetical protein M422DRAFT_69935 [Sphaerobolus stellatus SS14]
MSSLFQQVSLSVVSATLLKILGPGLIIYLYLLARHLRTSHPDAKPRGPPTLQEYELADSYRNIDILANAPREPTHKGYAIIGGSGFLGIYLVRLLLKRGEINIRIVDLGSPTESILSHPAVTYVKADITSPTSIRDALCKPFESTRQPPSIILHLAATIRFWDRLSYTWESTYRVNVQGTKNIIAALQAPPLAGHVRSLVYVSTGDVAIPRVKLWSFGKRRSYPWNTIRRSDSDRPLTEHQLSEGCYTRSKKIAEDLILAANGRFGLKTGSLRPGYTIIGPNDRLISSSLHLPSVPMFDQTFSHTDINAWDVVSTILLMEDALENRPDQVAGEAFLITGRDTEAWTIGDVRRAVKHYSSKPIKLQGIPPLFILILSHIIEAFLFARYHLLLFIFRITAQKRKPSLAPSWIGQGIFLQPATLEYFSDVIIDDSRARKLLGHKPQWGMLETIKNVVDDFEAETSGKKYGLGVEGYVS